MDRRPGVPPDVRGWIVVHRGAPPVAAALARRGIRESGKPRPPAIFARPVGQVVGVVWRPIRTRSPSSRQSRWTFLRLTTQPSPRVVIGRPEPAALVGSKSDASKVADSSGLQLKSRECGRGVDAAPVWAVATVRNRTPFRPSTCKHGWWGGPDSNPRPTDYESVPPASFLPVQFPTRRWYKGNY